MNQEPSVVHSWKITINSLAIFDEKWILTAFPLLRVPMILTEFLHVSGKALAEWRRLLVTESRSSEYMERKDRKRTGKCRWKLRERSKRVKNNHTCAWRGDDCERLKDDLSQCGCDA